MAFRTTLRYGTAKHADGTRRVSVCQGFVRRRAQDRHDFRVGLSRRHEQVDGCSLIRCAIVLQDPRRTEVSMSAFER
jgi:hypothetical protein